MAIHLVFGLESVLDVLNRFSISFSSFFISLFNGLPQRFCSRAVQMNPHMIKSTAVYVGRVDNTFEEVFHDGAVDKLLSGLSVKIH